MQILTDKHLFERELGNYMLSVPDLLEWAKSRGYFLRTIPELDGYDMVQVESLLCAIQRAAEPSLDDAMDMVAANPRLAGHRMADDSHLSRWLVGAEAQRQWREIITKAIADDELRVFDAVSLLPTSIRDGSIERSEQTTALQDDLETGELVDESESDCDCRDGGTPSDDWTVTARAIADEEDEKDAKVGAHDFVRNIGDRVAKIMRSRGIYGPRGPLSGSTITREALQGGKWKRKG